MLKNSEANLNLFFDILIFFYINIKKFYQSIDFQQQNNRKKFAFVNFLYIKNCSKKNIILKH
jgi:hypothetical protein